MPIMASRPPSAPAEAPFDCTACPRLVSFRRRNEDLFPDYHNAPVASFGDPEAEILIVGLAPGLKGANRTGRPFTGDYAGLLLYPTLLKFGFAQGRFAADPNDGLRLVRAMVTNAVRCVPPANKPVGAEIGNCRRYLAARIEALPRLKVLFALGRIAHESAVRALGERPGAYPFAHGAMHRLGGRVLIDSYHCSRYNVNTRRLTAEMFEAAFARAVAALQG
ncbi:MAG: uracil-DNA glycosylase [Rhodothalassiaceae bacterium]